MRNGLALLTALILSSPFPKVSGWLADQASVRIPRGFVFFKEMLICMGQTSALSSPLLLLFQIANIEIPRTWRVSGLVFLSSHDLTLCLNHGMTVRFSFYLTFPSQIKV